MSPQWTRVVALAERYAPTGLPVLLVGETGTGKELVAQHLHRVSGRRGDLVDVNCAALPHELTESLLFGYRRGAFTGALQDSPGLIAQAAGGTLFLDELSSMPVDGQAKLLRVLETGEVRRLGDSRKQEVDFRVVGAVQENADGSLELGHLRTDLYHRLAVVVIRIPSLRERMEDVAPLAIHFAAAHGLRVQDEGLKLLGAHDWPGNVRELRAVIDQAAVAADGQQLRASHLTEALAASSRVWCSPTHVRGDRLASPEYRLRLLGVCERLGGDREAIARAVGVSRATLYRRLKAAGITLRQITASHSFSHSHEDVRIPENSHGSLGP
jgi:transcriptional regulator with PAS, ATPase and Fis domain